LIDFKGKESYMNSPEAREISNPPPPEEPEKKKKSLAGPKRKPVYEIGPDGTVRTIRTAEDAKDLAEERREQFRDVKP
jgi:hypothetical protein